MSESLRTNMATRSGYTIDTARSLSWTRPSKWPLPVTALRSSLTLVMPKAYSPACTAGR